MRFPVVDTTTAGEVTRVAAADRAPDFDEWVAVRGPALLRLARGLTGDAAHAEDLVQESLARALSRWSRIGAMADPYAYVRRMVVHEHTSWWRRFGRRETPTADSEPFDGLVLDPVRDDRDRVWAACRGLPRDQRTAVVLRYYEQLEYAEIADLTGVREGTVRSRVSRGLAVLREELGDDD